MALNFAGALGALGGFTSGYLKGKNDQEQRMRDEKRHEMETQRVQLELDRAKDEKSMREELKKVSEKPKAVETFTVVGPGGPIVYADKDLAEGYAKAQGGEGAAVQRGYAAAGKTYASQEEADQAVEAQHTPAALARRQMEVAKKYVRPDLAGMYAKSYRDEVDQNKRDMQEKLLALRQRGDIEGAADLYNQNLRNGEDAAVEYRQDGSVVITKTKAGQPLGAPQVFSNASEFWNGDGTEAKPGVIKSAMATPDNMAELWYKDQGLALQRRTVASQEKVANASAAKSEAEVAQMPEELKLKARQVGAAETSARATASNASTSNYLATRPTVMSGFDPKTNEGVVSATRPYQDKDGNWQLEVMPSQTMKGLTPMPMASESMKAQNDPLRQMGTPQLTPEQIAEQVKLMFPSKNIAPPARPLGGGLRTTFPKGQ